MIPANSASEQKKREGRKFKARSQPKMTVGEKVLAKENKQKELI